MVYRKRNYKKTNKKTGLKKRWYFSAGAKLPIVGQTNISFGSGSLNKRSLTSKIKATELRLAETKRKTVTNASIPTSTHNTIYTFNPLGNITAGTAVSNRLGDRIFVKGINVRLHLFSPYADQDVKYRFIVCKHDDEYLSASDAWGSGLGSSQLFYNYNDGVIAQTDPRRVHIIHDEILQLPRMSVSATPAQNVSLLKDMYINVSHDQQYVTGTNFNKKQNLYLAIIPYRVGGTTGTTICGQVDMSAVVTFKDM